MIPKRLEDISKTDIEALVLNRVGESKTIEFKSQLPGGGSEDRKETVRDIASFANASGGDIIYGIEETASGTDKGRAEKIVPITGTSVDEAKLRLEQLIQNGLSPTLKVQMTALDDFDGVGTGFVLLVRIPQSLSAPHMVTLGDSYRFYSRTSSGKFPMKDVGEIRNAFLATESQGERVRNFIRDRLSQIVAGETPFSLFQDAIVVTHVIPVASFLSSVRFSLSDAHNLSRKFFPPGGAPESRFNFDGLLMYSMSDLPGTRVAACAEYTQVYFNGAVENIDAKILQCRNDSTGYFPAVSFASKLLQRLESYLDGYRSLGISMPVVVSVSLLGCQGTFLRSNDSLGIGNHQIPLERKSVILPSIVIDDIDEALSTLLRPLLDSIWNAYGYDRSYNYSPQGELMNPS